MKILTILLLLTSINFEIAGQSLHPQIPINEIYKIINLRLKKVNKHDKSKETMFSKSPLILDSIKIKEAMLDSFEQILGMDYSSYLWEEEWITNKKLKVVEDTTLGYFDFYINLSLPLVSKDRTRVLIYEYVHTSEWGAHCMLLIYKKKKCNWKFIKSHMIWIS